MLTHGVRLVSFVGGKFVLVGRRESLLTFSKTRLRFALPKQVIRHAVPFGLLT